MDKDPKLCLILCSFTTAKNRSFVYKSVSVHVCALGEVIIHWLLGWWSVQVNIMTAYGSLTDQTIATNLHKFTFDLHPFS